MKRIFFFLSIITILSVVYLILLNTTVNVDVNYIKSYFYSMDFDTPYVAKTLKLSTYTLAILLAGMFSGCGILSLFLGVQKDKVKAYKRELEKTAISGEANASRVEVLEAKIKTLEKAFTSVADERTKMEVQIKNLNAEIENLNKNK